MNTNQRNSKLELLIKRFAGSDSMEAWVNKQRVYAAWESPELCSLYVLTQWIVPKIYLQVWLEKNNDALVLRFEVRARVWDWAMVTLMGLWVGTITGFDILYWREEQLRSAFFLLFFLVNVGFSFWYQILVLRELRFNIETAFKILVAQGLLEDGASSKNS